MVLLIRWHVGRYFRWFDSGDLQSDAHFFNICQVAVHTREVLHWLPTQEYDIVRQFSDDIPENLVIRLSAQMIDGEPPAWWPNTSTVFTAKPPAGERLSGPGSGELLRRMPGMLGQDCGECRVSPALMG